MWNIPHVVLYPMNSAVELTPSQAAAVLGCAMATVNRHADIGLLEHRRTTGGHRRFRLDVVLAYKAKLEGDAA